MLFSANAKNFIGANADFKTLQGLVEQSYETLANYTSSEGIVWKFLPFRAPNFRGNWETGIKFIKYDIKY